MKAHPMTDKDAKKFTSCLSMISVTGAQRQGIVKRHISWTCRTAVSDVLQRGNGTVSAALITGACRAGGRGTTGHVMAGCPQLKTKDL